jgi:maleate isomerase
MQSEADTAPPAVNLKHLPYEVDRGIGVRANIGLVVLASDQTIEHEYRRLVNLPGVAVYQSRIANTNVISQVNLRAMEARITESVDLLLPGLPMDVVGYGCTSASIVIGEEKVLGLMKAARPESRCTTPVTAARAALAALEMKNIALLTPYTDDINDNIRAYLERCGIGVPVMGSFNVEDDREACRIEPAAIRDAAIELGRHDSVDGVFVSCTSLRVADVIQDIEDSLEKPATASNHAMAWHSLRLAGIDDTRPGYGRLYRL